MTCIEIRSDSGNETVFKVTGNRVEALPLIARDSITGAFYVDLHGAPNRPVEARVVYKCIILSKIALASRAALGLLGFVRWLIESGVSKDRIAMFMSGNVFSNMLKYVPLVDIYVLNDILHCVDPVDIATRFADPFNISMTPKNRDAFDAIVACKKYDFAGNGAGRAYVYSRIFKLLETAKRCQFLIKYTDIDRDWFRYEAPTDMTTLWSCDGISKMTALKTGDHTIAPIETVLDRFDTFTCGLLKKSINPEVQYDFPWESVIVAGGSVMKCLCDEYKPATMRSSDVDIFVYGKDHQSRRNAILKVLDWFQSPNTYYAVIGGVINVYINRIQRRFQIVSSDAKCAGDVLIHFDMDHIQFAYQDGVIFGTTEAYNSMKTKTARLVSNHMVRVQRIVKALLTGYHVERDVCIAAGIDITEQLSGGNDKQIRKIISETNAFYYPNVESEDDIPHVIAMIELDCNASLVTRTSNEAVNNMSIGISLGDYDPQGSFETFNTMHIVVPRYAIRSSVVRSNITVMRIRSDDAIIVSIMKGDTEVNVQVTPAFAAFCKLLDSSVFPMYNAGPPNETLIRGNGTVKIEIVSRDDRPILFDKQGAPIDLDGGMRIGDTIRFTFTIRINCSGTRNFVSLHASRVENHSYDEQRRIANSTPADVVEPQAEFVDEINY